MIGLLKGSLIYKKPQQILLDVSGVGYELLIPLSTFYRLPDIGAQLTIQTQLLIRENSHTLYGFCTEQEKEIFNQVIKISGVGPKLGLSILSAMNLSDLLTCIKNKDASLLVKVPGVGKKTAERLVIELQGKLDNSVTEKFSEVVMTSVNNTDAFSQAISGLQALGYKEQEAKQAVNKVYSSQEDVELLIRSALQCIGKKR